MAVCARIVGDSKLPIAFQLWNKKWRRPRLAYINRYVTYICIAETDIDMNVFGVGLAVGWSGGCHAAGAGQAVEICFWMILISFLHLCVHALDSCAVI